MSSEKGNITVGIHQPNFMPWMGFFNKIVCSDIFVLIDDVQFAKGSVCNRARIKNNAGQDVWLTVPVSFDNGAESTFNQTRIADKNWHVKALNLLKASYLKTPYFKTYYPEIEKLLAREYASLAAMNISLIRYFCEKLGITTPVHIQSQTGVEFGKKNDLNLGITRHFGGNIYLSGNGARKYNDPGLFASHGVEIIYQSYQPPQYQQLHGPFIEGLSIVDVLFNEGEKAAALVRA